MAPTPLVVFGAGPIGLAAAAHARARGLDVVVLEQGREAGAAVREWGHVRLFSSWAELVDPAAAALLAPTGWQAPDPGWFYVIVSLKREAPEPRCYRIVDEAVSEVPISVG